MIARIFGLSFVVTILALVVAFVYGGWEAVALAAILVTVGTFFMEEVLSLADTDLGLDRALRNQVTPHLPSLDRSELTALQGRAADLGLVKLATRLGEAAQQAPF